MGRVVSFGHNGRDHHGSEKKMDGDGSDRRGHFSFDGQLKQDDFKQKKRVKDVDGSLTGEQGFIVTVAQWVASCLFV